MSVGRKKDYVCDVVTMDVMLTMRWCCLPGNAQKDALNPRKQTLPSTPGTTRLRLPLLLLPSL